MGNKGAKAQRSSAKPRKDVVLIEIGNDWIKLVQAEARKNGGVTLSRVHLEPIDSDVVIADAIATALKTKKFSSDAVLACLPRQGVNIRLLELPSTDSEEIADMVDLQIGRQTPYSLDEILSDYKELGRTRQGTYTRIMLAIAQRGLVRERFHEIESAGLEIERMGVSSEGLLSWFLHRTDGESGDNAVALIDVDSFYTQLLVVHHRKVVFTKSILVGAKQLVAESGVAIDQLTQEIQSALQSCRADLRDAEIESVKVSGAGVRVPGLREKLNEALSLPCEELDCLADVKLGKGAGDLGDSRYSTVSLTGLIGIALNPSCLQFDLVPDVVRMRKQLMRSAVSFSVLAGCIMTAIVFASLYAVLACSFRVNRLKGLSAAVEETSPGVVRIERMVEVVREANARQDSSTSAVNLLPEIHSCVPKDMYFESVDIDQVTGKVSLSGTAAARKDIRDLIKMLEDSSLFETVAEDGRVTMDQEKRFKFKVKANVEEGA
jgi:Tfp pilus assembly PilM family ATPase